MTRVFVGEYERSVDGAGRIALPATFRDDLGAKCFVTNHPTGFVKVYSEERFHADADHVRQQVRAGILPESSLRALGSKTQVLSIDKHGRVTLDEPTRRHAGLDGQALVVGAIDALEIWRPSRYRVIDAEHDAADPPRRWDDEADGS